MDTTDIILFDNPDERGVCSINTPTAGGTQRMIYGDMPISFSGTEEIMVNATEMAKAFGKRPVDWLKTQAAKDYIDALSKVKIFTLDQLVVVSQGGSNPGTWFHESVAIEFARWLDPKFAIWCNDVIKRILKVTIDDYKRRIEAMETTMIPIISVSITMDDYAQVLSTYSGNEIGRTKLMDLLRKLGYIQKTSNLPYQAYVDRKFFVVVASSGRKRPSARITPKGQRFVSRRLMRILPVRIPISIPLF